MKRRLLATLVCCGVLTLAGCSDDSSSTVSSSPPTPTESSSSASPTSTASTEPESPKQFVARWIQVANQLGRDGDADALKAASHKCPDCTSIANGVASIYEAGGWIKGGDWAVLGPLKTKAHPGNEAVLVFEMSIDAGSYKRNADATQQSTPSGTATIQATVGPIDGEFKMLDFVRLAND